jgi:hypothetical protein
MSSEVDLNALPLVGRSMLEHRMAIARLQVLWPLMCYHSVHRTIYGFAGNRSGPLGLDRKEMLRWWAGYSDRGVSGAVQSGVHQAWKIGLPELEKRLMEERLEWAAEGDTFFVESLRTAVGRGGVVHLQVPQGAQTRRYAVRATEGEAAVKPLKWHTLDQTIAMCRRIGVCREILLKPVLSRMYTDAAINSYAHDWGLSGPLMRNWLQSYDAGVGSASVAPIKLTGGMARWLRCWESQIRDLEHKDTRVSKGYWKELTGGCTENVRVGIASKRVDPSEGVMLAARYEAVKIAVMRHLDGTGRRRFNDQAGIAQGLLVSQQTLTNWKTDWARRRSMRPRVMTEAMASNLDAMERFVAELASRKDEHGSNKKPEIDGATKQATGSSEGRSQQAVE